MQYLCIAHRAAVTVSYLSFAVSALSPKSFACPVLAWDLAGFDGVFLLLTLASSLGEVLDLLTASASTGEGFDLAFTARGGDLVKKLKRELCFAISPNGCCAIWSSIIQKKRIHIYSIPADPELSCSAELLWSWEFAGKCCCWRLTEREEEGHVTPREYGPIGASVYPFTLPTWLITRINFF